MAITMSLNPVFMYELDLRVGEIAEELRNADVFVSHDLVSQILADRYNVVSLSQLGISSPKSLPLLGLVFSLNCAVSVFNTISLKEVNVIF